jgi:4'-phosphopantetheinyl transferase
MQSVGPLSGLNTGKIDIWFSRGDWPASEIKKFKALLSSEEKARAQRFRFLSDYNRYIVQHGVLRLLLAGHEGCKPGQIDIRTSVNGKPYLAGQQERGGIHFSLSSSDAFIAIAFSHTGSIGVDIEKIRDIPDMLEIVERHFTSGEKCQIFSCPENLRAALFYKFWTRKEAVLKAQGEGLLKPLDCVDVAMNLNTQAPCKVRVAGLSATEEFWVADIDGPAGFRVAVASTGHISQIAVQNFNCAGYSLQKSCVSFEILRRTASINNP